MSQRIFYPFSLLFLFFVTTANLHSQISITSEDILDLIGTTLIMEIEEAESIIVDVGPAGENQQWNLTQAINERSTFEQIFLAPDNTQLSSDFPNANFAWSILGTEDEDIGEIALYEYFEVTPDSFSSLGGGVYSSQFDTSIIFKGIEDIAPLPLNYNTTWTATETDTSVDFIGFSLITIDTTVNTVDGWGTLTLPSGTFDCLRVRAETRCMEITKQGDAIINTEVSTSIQYTWVSNNHFLLAHVESQEDETNLNFTNAFVFERLTQSTTPILTTRLDQLKLNNYPNPLRSATTFSFYLPQRDKVELQIFDMQGRQVAIGFNGLFDVGHHRVQWQNHLNSGLYLYQLKTSDQVQTNRLVVE